MVKRLKINRKIKKAQALPFNWIFAIVVGAVIIFLAIFSASRYINLQRYQFDTEIAAQLSLLLNPLETTVASATASRIELPANTRLQFTCKFTGIGKEELSISTRSALGKEWQEYGAKISMYNKYVFSRNLEEGKKLYLFSKTFSMPFKIADLIYLTTSEFCFVNPPAGIVSEVRDLEMENVQIVTNKNDCKKDVSVKKVCFGTSSCEINVYGQCYGYECSSDYNEYDYGLVENREDERNVEKVYYVNPELLYAAIFSSPELYNCNVNRLMYRINMISRLYMEKINLLEARGCGTGELGEKLGDLAFQASFLTKLDNVIGIQNTAKQVESINSGLVCNVF